MHTYTHIHTTRNDKTDRSAKVLATTTITSYLTVATACAFALVVSLFLTGRNLLEKRLREERNGV